MCKQTGQTRCQALLQDRRPDFSVHLTLPVCTTSCFEEPCRSPLLLPCCPKQSRPAVREKPPATAIAHAEKRDTNRTKEVTCRSKACLAPLAASTACGTNLTCHLSVGSVVPSKTDDVTGLQKKAEPLSLPLVIRLDAKNFFYYDGNLCCQQQAPRRSFYAPA